MFANPFILWGLAGASLPILIHLLNRRKFREETWAAMRFLLAAIRKNQRRVRLEQWLLLAVRTLIILLVVLAMARPLLEASGVADLFRGQKRHWVLVLDGSMSMDYRVEGKRRYDQALDIARRIVKDARQGDAFGVVMMADPPRAVIGKEAFSKDEVLKTLDTLAMTHGGTDLPATFEKVDEVLGSSVLSAKEVVFVTDLQAASWKKPGSEGSDALKKAIAKLDNRQAHAQVIDLGATGGKNRAIVDVALDTPIVTANAPVVVRATLKNFGRDPTGEFTARLSVDDAIVDERPVRIGAGETEPIAFRPTRFPKAGTATITVTLPDDDLRVDDARRLVVDVKEAVEVLIVDGDPKGESFRSDSDFLVQALSPEPDASAQANDEPPSIFRTKVVPESQLSRMDLAPYDAVVLANVASFTDAEANALDGYLKQGGGLVVFGGDQAQADNYNRVLHKGGKGLLPAALGPTVGELAKPEVLFTFDPLKYKHPIVADFDGQPPGVQASLTNVKTFRYHKLRVPKDSDATVALAFDDGDPAVVEAPRHRGRVVQVATTADRDWTSWPLHQSYPPVMEQCILFAAAGRAREQNVQVGRPLSQAFPASAAGAEAVVKKPAGGGPDATVKLSARGDVSQFSFDDTDRSGVYSVAVGPPVARTTAFAANPDPIESDPAKLNEGQLKDAVRGWRFVYDNDWRGLEKNAQSVSRRGEMHRPLLWTVLILLLVESIMAWKFGHHR